jgi:hypothetical protein
VRQLRRRRGCIHSLQCPARGNRDWQIGPRSLAGATAVATHGEQRGRQ